MKTLGQTLRGYREKKSLSLAQLAAKVRVPEVFLSALEEERYSELPTFTLVRGYTQLIASELGLNEETALALLRRDWPKAEVLHKRGIGMHILLRRRSRWLSPQTLSFGLLGAVLLFCLTALAFQWHKLGKPPELNVASPKNYDIVRAPVTISGQTESGVSLTINTEVVSLDPQGHFSFGLDLPIGERAVVLQATDNRGQKTEKILFVTVEP